MTRTILRDISSTKYFQLIASGITVAQAPAAPAGKLAAKEREELEILMNHEQQKDRKTFRSEAGFSLVDISIVAVVIMIVMALAIPQLTNSMRALRLSSDARSIASQLALAKMRAANGFTQSRLNCNTSTNSCQIELCTSKGTGACNTFTAEGGPVNLSTGVSFGYGSITSPAGTQSSIQNTTQILFNSRSIPVDSSGTATGNDGLYITDQYGNTWAITVYATGRIAVWRYNGSAWSLQ